MDTLIRCHVCGKDIAQTARKCPHCGATTIRTKKAIKWVIIATIIVLAALVITQVAEYESSKNLYFIQDAFGK